VSPERLSPYRVKARNTSQQSENAIHHDDVARRYGFRGGLVPGVTVYAYLTEPLVATFGAAWLERGTANVRFHKPVMDGEDLEVTGVVLTRDATGISATVTGATAATPEAATLTVTLPAGAPTPVNVAVYRAAPLPEPRPDATRAHLSAVETLGTPVNTYDEACATEWLGRVDDPLPLYRGRGGWVHPAFFLDQANKALRQNVRLGPWIHVGSVVRHLGGARLGETLATRGRVRSVFEKKGREFVELDLVVVAGERARPVAHILHTAIYRLPALD
jgi:acyl dehydratase